MADKKSKSGDASSPNRGAAKDSWPIPPKNASTPASAPFTTPTRPPRPSPPPPTGCKSKGKAPEQLGSHGNPDTPSRPGGETAADRQSTETVFRPVDMGESAFSSSPSRAAEARNPSPSRHEAKSPQKKWTSPMSKIMNKDKGWKPPGNWL